MEKIGMGIFYGNCTILVIEPFHLKMGKISQKERAQVVIDHFTKYIFSDQEFNDYLWVVGGYETKDVNTTEFVYDNKKAVAGPTLPFIVAHHCMVQVSDNAIYIIGGKVDGEISNQGFIYQVCSNHQIYKLS